MAIYKRCSDATYFRYYDIIQEMLHREIMTMTLWHKNRWIHLLDCLDKGNASPMEVQDALRLGYVPEYMCIRESRYSHLFGVLV